MSAEWRLKTMIPPDLIKLSRKKLQLFYVSPKGEIPSDQNEDRTNSFSNSLFTCVEDDVNNSNNDPDLLCGLDMFSIPYSNSDLADSKLWDSNLHLFYYLE